MRIQISLSTESIQNAIRLLNERKQMLEDDLEQFVEILANEGAEVANAAYGD